MLKTEVKQHLTETLIPFWQGMTDRENGGFYGYLSYGLELDRKAVKGCILNSRILWFFSNAYLALGEEHLLESAGHAFRFLRDHCLDREYGGVYWSLDYKGEPQDETKHTYNQAFAIYALSSYYDASKDAEALEIARGLYRVAEEKCKDVWDGTAGPGSSPAGDGTVKTPDREIAMPEGRNAAPGIGYREAFTRDFGPEENDKLSENGVMAEKTMNTLLHVFEAYTELYRVTGDGEVADRLREMLDIVADKVYNPRLGRQEVFFDRFWNPLIDLYSYGHDIEAAWLIDRGLDILGDRAYTERLAPITETITDHIFHRAYTDHSLVNEAENGVVDRTRVWWVQAEAVVGFLNGYQRHQEKKEYLAAAEDIWGYIRDHLIDRRPGSEWFSGLDEERRPIQKAIVDPWKCPYHNGRMCLEVMKRV